MSALAFASLAKAGGGGYRRSSNCIDSMACVPDWIVICLLPPSPAASSTEIHPSAGAPGQGGGTPGAAAGPPVAPPPTTSAESRYDSLSRALGGRPPDADDTPS